MPPVHSSFYDKFGTAWSMCLFVMEFSAVLRYPDPEDRILNRVISDISVVLRETALTTCISDSIQPGSSLDSEIGY